MPTHKSITTSPRYDVEDLDATLGPRLRALRTRLGLSLRGLAVRAGVTFGAVSQIENGHSSPSVATLKKILAALDTTLGAFFASSGDEPKHSGFVHRAGDLVNVTRGSGIKFLTLPGQTRDRTVQLMWEIYPRGKGTGAEYYVHAGEEGGFCVQGAIELIVDGRRELLGPGDAYYFDSTLPHSFKNVGLQTATIASACSPPSF
jgi:transcriptional regulator with XRE-family HTH domain